MIDQESICVLGLGYVGLTLAVSLANVGLRVHGLEVREEVLKKLSAGESYFYEEGLDQEIKSAIRKKTLTFSSGLNEIPFKPSVYIITVGTPLNEKGEIRLDMIEHATHEICGLLSEGDLVILRSTVGLGTTRNVVIPILNRTGIHFSIAVCPERTLEGAALQELHSIPQVIGSDDSQTTERCALLFGKLTPTTIKVSSLETAELIKLVDNTYRDVIFSFGNEVARVCDAAGINAFEVIEGGKLGYPRTNVSPPGLVGGPCLQKDPHILNLSALQFGLDKLDVTTSARTVNERQPAEIVRFIGKAYRSKINKDPKHILVAGLTFKGFPETDDLRGSMALRVLEALQQEFPSSEFHGFDPQLTKETIELIPLEYCEDFEEAALSMDLIVITNNHPQFNRINWSSVFDRGSTDLMVYDFWNTIHAYDHLEYMDRYVVLGNHTAFLKHQKG
jgi:UDP-N-acetyl-D-mannosaminuronic acid dehydrogenase